VSATLEAIQRLVVAGDVRISEHGYDELANDGITARDVLNGVSAATLVEDYPAFGKGPARRWCYNPTLRASRFASFGAFHRGTQARRSS
jgi:hypothetical protein